MERRSAPEGRPRTPRAPAGRRTGGMRRRAKRRRRGVRHGCHTAEPAGRSRLETGTAGTGRNGPPFRSAVRTTNGSLPGLSRRSRGLPCRGSRRRRGQRGRRRLAHSRMPSFPARDLTASLRIFRRSSFAWGPDGNTAVTTPAPAGSLTSREWVVFTTRWLGAQTSSIFKTSRIRISAATMPLFRDRPRAASFPRRRRLLQPPSR